MYVARFSYSIKPADRDRALGLLQQEVAAATGQGMEARLLVPLTRPPGGAALQYEVTIDSLDAFERFRENGIGSESETDDWAQELRDILLEPPTVELLRIAQAQGEGEQQRKLIGGATQHA